MAMATAYEADRLSPILKSFTAKTPTAPERVLRVAFSGESKSAEKLIDQMQILQRVRGVIRFAALVVACLCLQSHQQVIVANFDFRLDRSLPNIASLANHAFHIRSPPVCS